MMANITRRKGGAERYLVDLCARMAGEEFEVHVYAEHWDDEVRGVHIHRIKTIRFPKSLRLLSFAVRATKEIEKRNYDVTLGVGNTLRADIHQPHGGVHWAWFWRSLRAYDNSIMWVVKFLGRVLSPKQWVQGYIERAPFKRNDFYRIIAISDMVKQDVMNWYRIPENRVVVIYNGVDTERFHPRNRQYREEIRRKHGIGDEFVILFVSNNFRMKGLGHLIKALADLKKRKFPPFKCLILGRDKKVPYVRLARRLEISGEVIFVGSTDEPEKYYGAADLLVHPTFYDACSLTVLEALASGLPVITTVLNGAAGTITDGQGGFVIQSPRDHQALPEKIGLFFDERRREESRAHARRCVERFPMELNYREMVSVLLKSVEDRRVSNLQNPSRSQAECL
jgi:UDP-glucose:(heptosyl)LPS alpha-1,3-glucosyltransferase